MGSAPSVGLVSCSCASDILIVWFVCLLIGLVRVSFLVPPVI